ncbi:MAG: hypothetical protein D9C04_00440 [Nitrosopumilus sp. B06]|nr:MAG: hypothetical protein D9C04_00440 [Nitrosopumilus sp. B06]
MAATGFMHGRDAVESVLTDPALIHPASLTLLPAILLADAGLTTPIVQHIRGLSKVTVLFLNLAVHHILAMYLPLLQFWRYK